MEKGISRTPTPPSPRRARSCLVGTTTTGRLLRANPPSTAPRLPLPLPRRRVPRSSSVPSPVRASSGTRYAPTPPSPRALLPRGRGHEHEHDWASAVWSGASGQTPLHRPAPPSPSPAATCAQVFFGSFASASIIRYAVRAHPFVFPSLLCDTEHPNSRAFYGLLHIYHHKVSLTRLSLL